jgi:hypothetical protein
MQKRRLRREYSVFQAKQLLAGRTQAITRPSQICHMTVRKADAAAGKMSGKET